MSKKTLILSQEQLDEICGGGAYLEAVGTIPDMGQVFSKEVSADGFDDDENYGDPQTTDLYAGDMSRPVHGYGAGGAAVIREMKKSDWEREFVLETKKKTTFGNKRLNNTLFGNGDQYNYDNITVNNCRRRKQEKILRNPGSSEEEKEDAAQTLGQMDRNNPQMKSAANRLRTAQNVDNIIQGDKIEGTKIEIDPKKRLGNGTITN